MLIGIHQGFEEPMRSIPLMADFLGAKAFQTFIRSNRGMKQRVIPEIEIMNYNQVRLADMSMHHVVHASYAMNPCRGESPYADTAERVITEDLSLIGHFVGSNSYVLHPGSSLDMGVTEALDNLVALLHKATKVMYNTSIAVEIMAGAGTQVMSDFDQIDYLLREVSDLNNVGLCYDTCHVFGAGMNLFETFVKYIDNIKVIHLNGSKAGFGSHVDRHASVRKSQIPTDSLVKIAEASVNQLPSVPIVLETPHDVLLSDLDFIKSSI